MPTHEIPPVLAERRADADESAITTLPNDTAAWQRIHDGLHDYCVEPIADERIEADSQVPSVSKPLTNTTS